MLKLSRVLLKPTISRLQSNNVSALVRSYSRQKPSVTTAAKDADEAGVSNDPIQFFGSHAASWRAKDTRSGGSEEALWYQPYVISASLAIFLVYFCILREENDIDRKLEGNLYDQVDGLEQVALVVNYKYNKAHGLDTRDAEQRLKELGVDTKQIDAQV